PSGHRKGLTHPQTSSVRWPPFRVALESDSLPILLFVSVDCLDDCLSVEDGRAPSQRQAVSALGVRRCHGQRRLPAFESSGRLVFPPSCLTHSAPEPHAPSFA